MAGLAVGCGHRADYGGVAVSAAPLMRSLDREAMIRASTAAVAVVETDVGRGMAFVVDPAGYLVTNRHVVEDGDHVEAVVFPARDPGRLYESVEVVYVDPVRDLALLRVNTDEPLPYLPLASEKVEPVSRYLAKHDPVVLLQRHLDRDDPGLILRRGSVDRLQVFNPAAGPTAFLGVTADVRQGQSGGPVLDRYGRAVGIVTWTWRDEPGGFAIPISEVTRMLEQRPALQREASRKARALSRTRSFLDAVVRRDLDAARRLTSPSHARKIREVAVDRMLGEDVPEGLKWFVHAVEDLSDDAPPTTDDELAALVGRLDELVAGTVTPKFRSTLGKGAELPDGQVMAFFRELGKAYVFARVFGEQPPPDALGTAVRRLRTVDAARTFAVAEAASQVGDRSLTVEEVEVYPGEYAPRAVVEVVHRTPEGGPPVRLSVHLRMEWGDWYVAEVGRTALSEPG